MGFANQHLSWCHCCHASVLVMLPNDSIQSIKMRDRCYYLTFRVEYGAHPLFEGDLLASFIKPAYWYEGKSHLRGMYGIFEHHHCSLWPVRHVYFKVSHPHCFQLSTVCHGYTAVNRFVVGEFQAVRWIHSAGPTVDTCSQPWLGNLEGLSDVCKVHVKAISSL